MSSLAAILSAHGLSSAEAHAKAPLLERCSEMLATFAQNADAPDVLIFAPGRIEVLGKHTDYAGGRSLLCAMERGFVFAARRRTDAHLRVMSVATGDMRELSLRYPHDASPGDWSAYVSTVATRLARDFPSVQHGADIAFASDLPAASGMSSSSALVIGIFLVLDAMNGLSQSEEFQRVIDSPEALGNYLGAVENGHPFGALAGGEGVGTLGGSQDQTAILCCRAAMLSQYAFCPVRAERTIAFPADRVFVVAYSGVAAPKTASALLRYNEASLAVERILATWNGAQDVQFGSLGDAVASATDAAPRIRERLASYDADDFTAARLVARFDQFVAEAFDIIPATADALARNDLVAVGALVDRSQRGAEDLLGNQVPETVALTRLAREHGADAASAFGAGFGGSVWALVAAENASRFADAWRAAYAQQFPVANAAAEFIITPPGPAATRLR